MIRKTSLVAAALTAVASVAAGSPAPAVAGHGSGSSPVLGYILIQHNIGQNPTFTPIGVLGNSALWTCTHNLGVGPLVGPYVVTCVPTQNVVNLVWHCDVLHADVMGLTATARARTSMDCNGDNVPEAQTVFIGGTTYDYDWGGSNVPVSKLTCTVDNNNVPTPAPQYRAGCGDPGLVQVH